ncbi:class I adenylate-forming enzyme family protein [Sciscionella sediminilitoris]|uniref:class I adenylate-forming enzyme family protein n=1 Tax=Sciscionella sediminilitoris TaxID=1445613 RepID=UPI0004DF3BA0|nr:AMP-binding protein [Sciscionella sp. SE31]
MTTIPEVLRDTARTAPEGIGWVDGDREIPFAELDRWSDRVAEWLLRRGIRHGDRIAVNGPNRADWLAVYFAAAKIGAVLVGLSPRYRETEFGHILGDSGARLVITVPRGEDVDFLAVFRNIRGPAEVVSFAELPPAGEPDDPARLAEATAPVTEADPVMIIYTSGTTGCPKGAVLTHRGQLAAATAQAEHTRMGAGDVVPLAVPLNHVSGITCCVLTCLVARARVVLLPRFDAASLVESLDAFTLWVGVPTMHTLLLRQPRFAEVDTTGIRLVITGGANAEPDLVERLTAGFPNATVMNLYGLSETSGAVIMTPWEAEPATTAHAIGAPLPGAEITIADDQGAPLGAGETGELLVRGPSIMAGYHGNPAPVLDAHGWLHTGDMAVAGADGSIALRGRAKDMFVQGGFNIYPVEVENLLLTHPDVVMAAGIGVPDPVLGEIGRYYLVLAAGSTLTEDELNRYCAERIADYKVPKEIVLRAELPLTPAGKIQKAALRAEPA